jgi:hypothetical protein
MKNFLFLIFIIFIAACTKQGAVIEGTLSSDRFDNETVYWVPMEGAHPKPVDSTRIHKNTFRIVISDHNLNKMGIVRVKPVLRLALQDILVFTETGTVQVHLDSISRATGSPLNETLQYWKDRKQAYDMKFYASRKKMRTASEDEKAVIKTEVENESTGYHDEIFQIVVENKDNEVGKFIYSLYKARFTPEQIQKLGMDGESNVEN